MLYIPISSATNRPSYAPSSLSVQASGTSTSRPAGVVTRAVTWASLVSRYASSATRARSTTGSPGATRVGLALSSTRSGTSSSDQRSTWRQSDSWVWSSSETLACICQSQVSCTPNTAAVPRPNRCTASTGTSLPLATFPVSSAVAPGLSAPSRLTEVSGGSESQRPAGDSVLQIRSEE